MGGRKLRQILQPEAAFLATRNWSQDDNVRRSWLFPELGRVKAMKLGPKLWRSLPNCALPTNQHLLPAVKVLGCQIWSASQRLVVSWETQAGRGGCRSSGVEVVGARCSGHLSEPALSPNVFLLFVQVTDWNVPIIFWVHIASALGRGFAFVSVQWKHKTGASWNQ